MSDFHRDLLNGLVFIIAIAGFLSGEYIISSALFAATAVASNINQNRRMRKQCHSKMQIIPGQTNQDICR